MTKGIYKGNIAPNSDNALNWQNLYWHNSIDGNIYEYNGTQWEVVLYGVVLNRILQARLDGSA